MRTRRARCTAVAVSMLLLGAASGAPAHAQPAAKSAPTTTPSAKTAQDYYDEGIRASKQKQWEKARAALLEAWRLQQNWQTAANLGRAEFSIEKYRDAAEHLAYFLREAPAGPASAGPGNDRRTLQDMFDKARAKVGGLRLSVSAEVLVDGASVSKAPLADLVFVEPGTRVVEVRLDGGGAAKQTVTVAAGGEVKVELQPMKEPAAVKGVVEAPGGAAGSAAPGGSAAPKETSGGEASAPSGPPEAGGTVWSGPVNKTWVIVGASASAALGLAGIGLAAGSQAARTASKNAATLDQFHQLQDRKVAFGWASVVTLFVAGAASVATTTYALQPRGSQKPKSSVSADVVVGSQGVGATLTKTW